MYGQELQALSDQKQKQELLMQLQRKAEGEALLWKQNEQNIINSSLNEQKQLEKNMLSTIYK